MALKKLAQLSALQGKPEIAISPENLIFIVSEVESKADKLSDIQEIVLTIKNNTQKHSIAHEKLFSLLELNKEDTIKIWKNLIKETSTAVFKKTLTSWRTFSPLVADLASSSHQFWKSFQDNTRT